MFTMFTEAVTRGAVRADTGRWCWPGPFAYLAGGRAPCGRQRIRHGGNLARRSGHVDAQITQDHFVKMTNVTFVCVLSLPVELR